MTRAALSVLLGACALFGSACGGGDPAGASTDASTDAGQALPEVPPGVDLAALLEEVRPRDGEKAVLVNFWATWCPPCVAEMPELVQLYEDHLGGDVRVVAVSLDLAMPVPGARVTDVDGVARFARRKGFDLPIVVYTGDAGALVEAFQLPSSIPTTIAWNADGEAGRLVGAGRRKQFDELIAKAIEGAE